MIRGERNENSEKTTIGLISKKATLHVQHSFSIGEGVIMNEIFFMGQGGEFTKLLKELHFML